MKKTLKRTRKTIRKSAVIAVLGLLGTGALFAYVKTGGSFIPPSMRREVAGQSENRIDTPAPDVEVRDDKPVRDHQQRPSNVDIATTTIDDSMNPSTSHEKISLPHGADPYVFSVNKALESTKLMPSGAAATSAKLDSDGLLTLDFSAAFDHTYGTDDESRITNSIFETLAQFKEVKKVRLTVEGKPLNTLGSSDLSEPVDIR